MIGRQRTLRETLAGKHHQAYLVVRTVNDKVTRHLFGGLQTIRLQVLCQHRSRYIERHHDVDTFGTLRRPFIGQLRTRQGYTEQYHYRHAQQERHMQQPDS